MNKTKNQIKDIVNQAVNNFKFSLKEFDFEHYYNGDLDNNKENVFKKNYLVEDLNLPYNLEMKVLVEYIAKENNNDELILKLALVDNKSDIVNRNSTKLKYDFEKEEWINSEGE